MSLVISSAGITECETKRHMAKSKKKVVAQEPAFGPVEREISLEELQSLPVGCRVNICGTDESGKDRCIKCTVASWNGTKFLTYRYNGELKRTKIREYPGKRFAKVV